MLKWNRQILREAMRFYKNFPLLSVTVSTPLYNSLQLFNTFKLLLHNC